MYPRCPLAFVFLYAVLTLKTNHSLDGLGDSFDKENNWFSLSNVSMSNSERLVHLHTVRDMFDFAYHSYMKFAYPKDELNPINCSGRGYDYENRDNINVNDALGDYHLSLIDTLDTLAVMGKSEEFKSAVKLVIDNLSFTHDTRVQVFEATIRVLGGLLSAHLLITDKSEPFGPLAPSGYDDELLNHAHDLANRMMDSLYSSPSGLPYPRFHTNVGVADFTTTENCLAGAGSLLLEFGCLSALLGDPIYASAAKRIVLNLWGRRSNVSGLFGSTIDIRTGEWINRMSGLGAGQDSFYEYLQKAYVLFGDQYLGRLFKEVTDSLRFHLRTGRPKCLSGSGPPPIYWNVDMFSGAKLNHWVDTLQSSWPAVLVLNGDLDEAICQHAVHYFIWKIFGLPPERYNIMLEQPELPFYPLRPEFVESTYFLYRATKHPFYLHVGKEVIDNLKKYAQAKCGFATIHNVIDKSQEDRMESFFLSETLKYLYLLFDESNPLNRNELDYILTTQAHLIPIKRIRNLVKNLDPNPFIIPNPTRISTDSDTVKYHSCDSLRLGQSRLPMDDSYWKQLAKFIHSKFENSQEFEL